MSKPGAKKLKIGYVLDDTLCVPDGVQQAVLQIGEAMRSAGHEVHYITCEPEKKDITNNHAIGKSLSVKFNGNSVRTPLPTTKRKIKKLLDEVDFDILHVQMPYSPLFAAKVIRLAKKKTAVFGTFHILPYSRMSKYSTKLLSSTLRKSNKRINTAYAVSKPALEFMSESFNLDGDVLPNPVDVSYYQSFAREKAKNKFRIVYVGRFDKRKGVENLVRAVELLVLQTNKNIEVIMCGKGPLLNKMKLLAKEKSLPIKFPGFVDDKQKATYLASANIAVFPSISGESFGIVLTEAMASGAEITIGGNNPGYASVLNPWPETLFNPKNPTQVAEKLLELINDEELRKSIGTKQQKAVKAYDTKHIRDELEKSYYQVLAKRGKNQHN